MNHDIRLILMHFRSAIDLSEQIDESQFETDMNEDDVKRTPTRDVELTLLLKGIKKW